MHLAGDGFRASAAPLTAAQVARPLHEYLEGLRYMRQQPLILAVALLGRKRLCGGRRSRYEVLDAQQPLTLRAQVLFRPVLEPVRPAHHAAAGADPHRPELAAAAHRALSGGAAQGPKICLV